MASADIIRKAIIALMEGRFASPSHAQAAKQAVKRFDQEGNPLQPQAPKSTFTVQEELDQLQGSIPVGGGTKAARNPGDPATGPGPTIENEGINAFGDDPIEALGLNRAAIEEASENAPKTLAKKKAFKRDKIEGANRQEDKIAAEQRLDKATVNKDFDTGAPRTGLEGDDVSLESLLEDVADKAERAVKRAKTKELDLEGKEFEKGVQRVEDVRHKEITEDPLFPNPQHPRSLTGRAITKEAQKTEINAEVQDIIGRFKELFDVEKLKKANLKNNPTASRIQDAWKTLSTNANGARAGDVNALKKVRAIDEWLHKTANKETTPLANLEGPRREIPANVILQDILEGL